MRLIIDLGPELLVDGSTIRDPYLRLLTAAIGQKLAPGSPWVAVNKGVALLFCLPSGNPTPPRRRARRSRPRNARTRRPRLA